MVTFKSTWFVDILEEFSSFLGFCFLLYANYNQLSCSLLYIWRIYCIHWVVSRAAKRVDDKEYSWMGNLGIKSFGKWKNHFKFTFYSFQTGTTAIRYRFLWLCFISNWVSSLWSWTTCKYSKKCVHIFSLG